MTTPASSSSPPLSGPIHGAIARFATAADFIHALEQVRDAGYRRFDGYSPYPVHGSDDATGWGRSILPGIVLVGALSGTSFAFLMQWWTSAVNYPMVVGAKPYNSLEAFVPIMFELTVLFAAFTSLFGMLILNRLPKLYHPVFRNETFVRHATTDGFFISIEARDARFDRRRTLEFLASIGGTDIALLEE